MEWVSYLRPSLFQNDGGLNYDPTQNALEPITINRQNRLSKSPLHASCSTLRRCLAAHNILNYKTNANWSHQKQKTALLRKVLGSSVRSSDLVQLLLCQTTARLAQAPKPLCDIVDSTHTPLQYTTIVYNGWCATGERAAYCLTTRVDEDQRTMRIRISGKPLNQNSSQPKMQSSEVSVLADHYIGNISWSLFHTIHTIAIQFSSLLSSTRLGRFIFTLFVISNKI